MSWSRAPGSHSADGDVIEARPPWTNRPSPANPRPSSAKAAATAARHRRHPRALDEIKIRVSINPGEGSSTA